ncbi:MAG TPA: hypothetical protein GX743_01830 [Actinomycetales bacterium]|nr:hypothetical protein [Actinomycetales bacterium]
MSEPAAKSPYPRALLVGLGVPALLLLGAIAFVLANTHRLPPDVALHWGPRGPDRFGPPEQFVLEFGAIGAMMLLISALLVATTAGAPSARRIGVGAAVGVGAFLPLFAVVTAAAQFDITTGRDAVLDNLGMLLSMLGALALGVAGTFLIPCPRLVPATGSVPDDAPRLHGDEATRASWEGSVGPTRGVLIGIGVLFLPVIILAVWMATAGMWVLLPVMVLVLAALVAFLFFRVRIDAEGLAARSVIGFPTIRVPLAEVVRADTREVSPMGEFGGWGYRTNGRETGIVTRKGEGLVVERASGGAFVVTVDDAETAARTLNTLASRRG